MSEVTQVHAEKETLSVEVNIPGHEARTTTALFRRTRQQLLERDGGRCYICQRNAKEAGHPIEAHHYPIERSLANMIDWEIVKLDFPHFDWDGFDPSDPYSFVDDMLVNGMLLCKEHHTGRDEGIHAMPHPLWLAQRYAKEGYRFSAIEIIHHAQE